MYWKRLTLLRRRRRWLLVSPLPPPLPRQWLIPSFLLVFFFSLLRQIFDYLLLAREGWSLDKVDIKKVFYFSLFHDKNFCFLSMYLTIVGIVPVRLTFWRRFLHGVSRIHIRIMRHIVC